MAPHVSRMKFQELWVFVRALPYLVPNQLYNLTCLGFLECLPCKNVGCKTHAHFSDLCTRPVCFNVNISSYLLSLASS